MDRGSLLNILATHGDKKFLARDGDVSTYSDLLANIEKVDRYFRGTIPSGVCVALLGDYSIDAIACFIWLQANKNIIVPVSISAANEMTERCKTAHCEFLIDTSSQIAGPVLSKLSTNGDAHSLIERLREIQSAGLILFSSGSTGQPKAMIHDLDKLSEAYSNRKSRTLSLIIFLMFDHIGGVNTLLNSIYTGMFMVSPGNRDAGEVAKLIQKYSVSILPTSPTFLNLLLISDAPKLYDLSSLKFITYGTEPMPESLLSNLRTAFPNVRFQQTFGTSETGISRTDSKASGSLFMKFDDPDIEHSIVDGEL